MQRCVQPEILDALPSDDPRAVRSRRDLRRVNAWMRNPSIMATALSSSANGCTPQTLLDLGAGDGRFLLRVARQLSPRWRYVSATLLDRKNLIDQGTRRQFESLGWVATTASEDIISWANRPASSAADAIVANLFLHHLTNEQLVVLTGAIANRSRLFIAVEPRRGWLPSLFARLLWLIGCNDVTRQDAVVSVRAGFTGRELSALWPKGSGWLLTEKRAGLFSHLFIARRGS